MFEGARLWLTAVQGGEPRGGGSHDAVARCGIHGGGLGMQFGGRRRMVAASSVLEKFWKCLVRFGGDASEGGARDLNVAMVRCLGSKG